MSYKLDVINWVKCDVKDLKRLWEWFYNIFCQHSSTLDYFIGILLPWIDTLRLEIISSALARNSDGSYGEVISLRLEFVEPARKLAHLSRFIKLFYLIFFVFYFLILIFNPQYDAAAPWECYELSKNNPALITAVVCLPAYFPFSGLAVKYKYVFFAII